MDHNRSAQVGGHIAPPYIDGAKAPVQLAFGQLLHPSAVQGKLRSQFTQNAKPLCEWRVRPAAQAGGIDVSTGIFSDLEAIGHEGLRLSGSGPFDAFHIIYGGLSTLRHAQIAKVTQIVEKDKTKNKTSRRTFPLTPDVREMLLDLKRQEDENRRLFCSQYTENNYILKWDDGRPFAPDYVSHRFSRLLEIYEMPHIRFHELRHSCASFLLNTGFTLKDVQEWLGHSDIKMTANIYGHLDVGRKMGMAEKITATLSKLA